MPTYPAPHNAFGDPVDGDSSNIHVAESPVRRPVDGIISSHPWLQLPFEITTYEDYKKLWGTLPRVEIRMIEQYEECRHKVGDSFVYDNPYKKPAGVCNALLHVLDLYIWRACLGFPSWEEDGIYRIHCPDKQGTVWEMRRLED